MHFLKGPGADRQEAETIRKGLLEAEFESDFCETLVENLRVWSKTGV